jgi:ANTAR domain
VADRITAVDASSPTAQADLNAFFRRRDDVPDACRAAIISSLSLVRRSDDPVVTFAGLPAACVPAFADGCQVELSDGAESLFRVAHLASPAEDPELAAGYPVGRDSLLLTPFRVASRTGYPSYGGVVTHWWTRRTPVESDAAIADLMVKHLIALVDRERLMAALARAEDQAAGLALRAVSARAISIATGIVMHQKGLGPDDAEELLRQCARTDGAALSEVAACVVRSGSLAASSGPGRRMPGPVRSRDREPDGCVTERAQQRDGS